eukprot:6426466-Prymnesium_polylepis.1
MSFTRSLIFLPVREPAARCAIKSDSAEAGRGKSKAGARQQFTSAAEDTLERRQAQPEPGLAR